MSNHRVNVDNGKYTFVATVDDSKINILRLGESWHGSQDEVNNVLLYMMCELDAARVVIDAAREIIKRISIPPLKAALQIHDSLVDDREKASEWASPIIRAFSPEHKGTE